VREQLAGWQQRHMTPWRWFLLLAVAVEGIWLAVPPSGALVERWYSQGLYPVVSHIIVPIQNRMPVPVTAIILFFGIAAGLSWMALSWHVLRRAGKSTWRLVPRAIGLGAQVLVVFLLWSLVIWGAGYQRIPVTERWSLDDSNLTQGEAEQLRQELLQIIQENAGEARGGGRDAAVQAIAESMQSFLHRRGDGRVRVPGQVRATPPGLFLVFSTAGMCVPGAIEPFADGAYDDVRFVQVAAHELAHVAGYNRESEATLIGYLAGLATENALSRYAVALDIYMDLTSRIRDPEERKASWEALPEQAREDVERGRAIAERYRIQIAFFQRLGYQVYDTYLKSQGIEEGMANYSAGLRLFAGAWRGGLAATSLPRSEVT
jgi:hypothetical protein